MPQMCFHLPRALRVSAFALFLLIANEGCKTTSPIRKGGDRATPSISAAASDTAKPTQKIDLPVFIPVDQLQKQLYKLFFEPNYGKFYPCSAHDDCGTLYKDLYVEDPYLRVDGEMVAIKLHLAGNLNALIFHPSISGDIILDATPAVSRDTLYFMNVKMQETSQNFLLTVASILFEKKIVAKIQSKAWYSFRPTLDGYTKQFQKQTPLKWQSAALLLSLKTIYLKSVKTVPPPTEGIIADFLAEICTEQPTFGQ